MRKPFSWTVGRGIFRGKLQELEEMKGSLISGESIIYFYGLRDLELNNALKNGLTSYNPTTGEMYIDEQSIQKYKEKSIEVVRYD